MISSSHLLTIGFTFFILKLMDYYFLLMCILLSSEMLLRLGIVILAFHRFRSLIGFGFWFFIVLVLVGLGNSLEMHSWSYYLSVTIKCQVWSSSRWMDSCGISLIFLRMPLRSKPCKQDRNSYEDLLPTPLFFTARHREKAGNKPGERWRR